MSKTGASMARGKSKQDFATPFNFMSAVVSRFGPINFDLAAHEGNAKHANYFSVRDNSLVQEWHKIPGWLFLNPPFDDIGPWAEKSAKESALGAKILFLTPASVGSNWFRDHVFRKALVLALNGRIPFDPLNPTWGYPKDCQLGVFGQPPDFDVWRWTDDVI